MKLIIDIPEEFESHYKDDAFKDSLERLYEDAHSLAGNYEKEIVLMLIDAFKGAETLEDKQPEEVNKGDILTKEQIQKGCIGDVFTSKEFLEYVKTKSFTPYDGTGFVHNGYEELDNFDRDVFSYIWSMSEEEFCEKYPYVCWYNK